MSLCYGGKTCLKRHPNKQIIIKKKKLLKVAAVGEASIGMTSFLLKANSSKGEDEHDQPREITARPLGLSLIIFLVVFPLISKDLLALDAVSMADIRVTALGLGAPQKTPILAKYVPVLDVSCESTKSRRI